MRNARVFPLPVRAAPRTSLPFNDTGMLEACMSVISTKKHFLRPKLALSKGVGRDKGLAYRAW